MKKRFCAFILLLLTLIYVPSYCRNKDIRLELLYELAGADSPYYLPEAYYQPPIVEDLDKDGRKEIIFANYCLNVLDAKTGEVKWKINGGKDRSSPYVTGEDTGIIWDFEVCDINNDGYKEIVCAHAKGTVSVFSYNGYTLTGWPQRLWGEGGPVYDDARSVEICDLNNDGLSEIIIGASVGSSENIWVYDINGNIQKGWPQLASYQNAVITYDIKSGYSYGMFMDGLETGDINDDGYEEIIVTNDTQFLCAYDRFGRLVPANQKKFEGRTWGKIGLWESVETEMNMKFNEGWGWELKGGETRAERYFGTLTHGIARVYDVDNDGTNEVIVSTTVIDREKDLNKVTGDYASSRYMSVFIFNGDRTRFKGWESAPSDRTTMEEPLFQDPQSLACNVQAEPVIADLNNDGINEIVINTYDGSVHAFSIDNPQKEYGNFPYKIPQKGYVFENPGGVVCEDINGDGMKEVIFVSNTDDPEHTMTHGVKGSVYILDYKGDLIIKDILPDGYVYYENKKPAYTNCSMAKPCVSDIDGDGVFEIVVNTRYGGVCVYKINGSTTKTKAYSHLTKVSLDGKQYDVCSYRINGYNYYKLRDMAMLFKNSKKEFGIEYNSLKKAITVLPGKRYIPVGTELTKHNGSDKYALCGKSAIYIDNAISAIMPYAIDNNNYFKLRDVCAMVNVSVNWDEKSDVIMLSTKNR